MAVLGVGIDMVEVARIHASIARGGKRFIDRIAHPVEKRTAPATAKRRSQYWAARWAVKEAFAKALGTGIGAKVSLSSVGIARARSGRPSLTYSRQLAGELKKRGVRNSHVSVTHTAETAIAVVILEGVLK